MSTKYKYLIEAEPARPATADAVSSSPVYRSCYAKDGFPKLEGVTTLYELFTRSVEKYAKNACLGARSAPGADGKAGPYVYQTYEEVGAQVVKLASGLAAIGAPPKSKIGVLGSNCPEWMMAMQVG